MSKKETSQKARHLLSKQTMALGAVAIAIPGALAQRAAAQTGGTEAPSTPSALIDTISGSGGTAAAAGESSPTAMTAAEQALNAKAQQGVNAIAKGAMSIHVKGKQVSVSHMKDGQGHTLADTTITVPAVSQTGSNDGQYKFDIVSATTAHGKQDFSKVYSLTAAEGVTDDGGELNAYSTVS
jgi:hypothetical protein